MSLRLKIELAKILDVVPFGGLTPGSNAASYMAVQTPNGLVAGEDIESLLRAGWLDAKPLQNKVVVEAGENEVGAPDVEVTHAYDVTEEGLQVIAAEADAD